MDASTLIENLRGAGEIAFHLITPWRRPVRTTWGASADELTASWPGDDLVADVSWASTHAITIDAPPAAVWPWLAQIGQGRGGFYSYEMLENLVGCRIHNTDRILPALQSIAIGDALRLHPTAPPLIVRIVEPGRCLALAGEEPGGGHDALSLWALHLDETPDGATRLIERCRYARGRTVVTRWATGPAILEPVSFVMSRRMLRTIKGLVERGPAESEADGMAAGRRSDSP